MSKQSREERKLTAIRSISLEDVVMERHKWWRRLLRQRKLVVGVVSLLGLTAAAGSAAYQIWSGDEPGPLVVCAVEPVHTGSLPGTPSAAPKPRPEAAVPATAATETAASEAPVAPAPVEMARVPRPRPDEPMVTGSIAPAGTVSQGPRYASPPQRRQVARASEPCRTLQALTVRLPVTVFCLDDRRRFRPPPHARYVPGPPYVRW